MGSVTSQDYPFKKTEVEVTPEPKKEIPKKTVNKKEGDK